MGLGARQILPISGGNYDCHQAHQMLAGDKIQHKPTGAQLKVTHASNKDP